MHGQLRRARRMARCARWRSRARAFIRSIDGLAPTHASPARRAERATRKQVRRAGAARWPIDRLTIAPGSKPGQPASRSMLARACALLLHRARLACASSVTVHASKVSTSSKGWFSGLSAGLVERNGRGQILGSGCCKTSMCIYV